MYNKIFLGVECVHVSNGIGSQSYVCNAKMLIDGNLICATGEAGSLSEAEADAKSKLSNIACKIRNPAKGADTCYAPQHMTMGTRAASKDHLNGGGNRKITQGQINLLNRLEHETDCDVQRMAWSRYNKTLDELVGSEADALIKYLKRRG